MLLQGTGEVRPSGLERALVGGGVARFEGRPPTLEDFRAAMRPRLAEWPRLGLPEADLTQHVRQWVCRTGTGLNAAVEQVMSVNLRTERPLWELWLIRGYAKDEWAVVFTTHSALLDTASVIHVVTGLFDPVPIPRQRGRRAQHVPATRGWLPTQHRPLPLARRAFTHFDGSGERQFFWAAADRLRLDRVAGRHGVTVNDVFLAALTTALREWRHTPWERGLPCPVWTVVPGVDQLVLLPCHEPDPATRLAVIGAATAQDGEGGRPSWLAQRSRRIGLVAGSVPGSDRELAFQDCRMRELAPLGPLPRGHWLSAYLVDNADHAGAGFVMDQAVRGGAQLCRLWSLALAELDELG
ncbi:wax ester/triacylglycerol synthase family O-acyltransferase [Allokutzneria sp. A3M-2-11 16]|uniref:wax ester/triacylglycerol synthase family O-acyltransferase n=1 Tax=Allokutzneria sp. A3M-2-11 16 TaxID=2962043 RepID=UPI0020B8C754|nr:wax ester/triacylglycerol synthase family O-acyltransferase [Allokutzneria sp. A3M-2-11 16]MCP3804058.1 wax ester/triacylglycerol synthase family O-acyltransferase [Allokutzneria sp. A3M-2-11 16]